MYNKYVMKVLPLILILLGSILYVSYLESQKKELVLSKYRNESEVMHTRVNGLIQQKMKATVAMALSIASSKTLIDDVSSHNISKNYYKNLITQYKNNTLYKNIWIEIIDKDFNLLYRSWSNQRDNLILSRDNLSRAALEKTVIFSMSIDKFDLSLKAIVPLLQKNKLVGYLVVISHFNSISRTLQENNIHSVVLVNHQYSQQLQYPFTKKFVKDYYVANFDATEEDLNYLHRHKIEDFLNNKYKVQDEYLIVSQELKNIQGKVIAHFIMFKKLSDISIASLEYYIFKWFIAGMSILLSLIIFFGIYLFKKTKDLKQYYKNIIDSSTNVVVVSNHKKIIAVNQLFFKYVSFYKTLDAFTGEHQCICDFFEEDEGYIHKDMNGINWLDYILLHSDVYNMVKVIILEKTYYFSISASLISQDLDEYVIILSDITVQEEYKQEIELLNITDSLTGIGNRRYLYQKLDEEMQRLSRYQYKLSIMMFDIDFFKKVNDTHGHDVGDAVLKEYTSLIAKNLREGDIFCRVGGEEFITLLPFCDAKEALKIANKLRETVQAHKKIVPITMSFGVVEYVAGENTELSLKRVDKALYEAKESGRNTVVLG